MAETDGSLPMKPSHEPMAKPSAPPVDETVAAWKQDPEFNTLPPARQASIVTNFFRSEYGGEEFEALPQERQSRILQNFISANLGDTGSVRMPVNKAVRQPVGPSKSPMDQQLAVKRANEEIGSGPLTPTPQPTESQFHPVTSALIGPEARRREDAQTMYDARSSALGRNVAPRGMDTVPKNQLPDMGLIDTGVAIGGQLYDALRYHMPAAVAASVEGDEPFGGDGLGERIIGEAREQSKRMSAPGDDKRGTAIPGVSVQDIRGLGPSMGFSLVGMGAGIGAGLAATALTKSGAAGLAAGTSASTAVAYRQSTNQFLRDLRDAMDAERSGQGKPTLTDDEFKAHADKIAPLVREYGLFEAIPETAGNLAMGYGFGFLKAPVAAGIKSFFGQGVARRMLGKAAAVAGGAAGEVGTEAITGQGQHNVEVRAGMNKGQERSWLSPEDLSTSLNEVLGSTLLQTAIMGGAGKAGQKLYQTVKGLQKYEGSGRTGVLSADQVQALQELNRSVEGSLIDPESAATEALRRLSPSMARLHMVPVLSDAPTDLLNPGAIPGPSPTPASPPPPDAGSVLPSPGPASTIAPAESVQQIPTQGVAPDVPVLIEEGQQGAPEVGQPYTEPSGPQAGIAPGAQVPDGGPIGTSQPAEVEEVEQRPEPERPAAPEVGPGIRQPEGPGRVDAQDDAGGAEPSGPAPGVVRGRSRHVAAISGVKGEKFPVHYELRELDDIQASHLPLENFRANPVYPGGVQDRPYATDKTHQDQVNTRARTFDPMHLVNTGPTAETGPSVVTRDGFVIGGNSRKMVLDILRRKFPEAYQSYRDSLKEEAAAFGIAPEDVDKFKSPVLVRALDFDLSEKDERELGRISGVLNKPAMTGQDTISKGVAAAKALSKGTLSKFASGLSGYDTLRAYLDSGHASEQLVPLLESDGVLDIQNRAQYLVDGKLTPQGKDNVEAAIRGFVIPDNDLLQNFRRANADELKTFDFALPHLAYAKALGQDWVTDVMSRTIRLFLDYNASKSAWQSKNKGDMRRYNPDFYLKQGTLLGDVQELKDDKTVREQFRALVTFKPREYAAAWKGYASALQELISRPTMPGIEIDAAGLRKIVDDVMVDYDRTLERAPKSYKDMKAKEDVQEDGQQDAVGTDKDEDNQGVAGDKIGDIPEVKESDVPLTKAPAKEKKAPESAPDEVIDLVEEDTREPWEMTLREFAGKKPSPPQIVGGKAVGGEGLKEWNAKAKEYTKAVAEAFRSGKLTLDEVRVKTPDQWLEIKGEVKPPVEEPKKDVQVPPTDRPAVKPSVPVGPKPESVSLLKGAGLKVNKYTHVQSGKPFWDVTGKTRENKDAIKAAGGRYVKRPQTTREGQAGKTDPSWRFYEEPTDIIAEHLESGEIGERSVVGGRGLGEGVIGVQIKALRTKLDAMPNIATIQPEKGVADATRGLIRRGEGSIPKEVLNAQIQDIGKISSAYRTGKKAFVLASDPGMGKTFVLAGALKEIARNHAGPIVWVTQNRRLISQIQADIEPFGLNDRIQFITYTDMSAMKAEKAIKDPERAAFLKGLKISGAVVAWDEGHSVKNTSAMGEEDGAARADLGQKFMGEAKFNILASATPFENPTQMGYIAASGVFDQLADMTGLKRAITGSVFSDFALAYGAGMRKFTPRGGREKQILEWERGKTPEERRVQNENAMAAREWLEKQGMLAQREMRLEPNMVTTELKAVPATQLDVDLIDRFTDAMVKAIEQAGEQRLLRRNLAGYMTNTLKRIMEDAKVDAAIAEAKDVISQGKQAVIFVETRAKKEITGREYPAMLEQMMEWQAEQQAMGDAGTPPYSRFQMAVAEALHTAGLDQQLESTVGRIVGALGKDKTAVFTGDVSEGKANTDLDSWLDNKKPLLVATMAKGGTGLSLHSRRPGDPERVLIGLNMPWTATVMKQVLGRVTRLGMLKPSEVRWMFLDHDFERMIAAKVGGRMQDMGAVVSGKVPQMGQSIEAFDFDSPVEGAALESLLDSEPQQTEQENTAEADVVQEQEETVEVPKPATMTAAEVVSDSDLLTILAKGGDRFDGARRVEMARQFAEGVAFDAPGFDMEPNPYGGLTYSKTVPGGVVLFHEIDGSLEFKADDMLQKSVPLHSLRKKSGVGQVTTDPRLIKSILFKDILNQNPSRTVVSELFQNAIDAFIDMKKWPDDASITVGAMSRDDNSFIVAISDNGVGMTEKDVHKHYLAIGAKGKEGTENVGGFGMAKVAFLFYPQEVTVTTTKNGITTIIKATREQLMDGQFPVQTRPAEDGERGTTYVAIMPVGQSEEGQSYDSMYEFDSAISFYVDNTAVDGLTIYRMNHYDHAVPRERQDWEAQRVAGMPEDSVFIGRLEYTKEGFKKREKVTPSKRIVIGENTVDVHFLKTEKALKKAYGGTYVYPAQVYSKGMPLPALVANGWQLIDGISTPGLQDDKTKFEVAIDFVKTYKPEDARYPFLKNRTVVQQDVGEAVGKVIAEYVQKVNDSATDERVEQFRTMMKSAPVMGGVPVLIPKESYPDTDAVKAVIQNHENFFSGYGKLIALWQGLLDSSKLKGNTKYMVTLDHTVYGWHAPDALSGEGNIIAMNPLTMLTRGEFGGTSIMDTSEYKALVDAGESKERILASAFVHTALHERVHDEHKGHNENFSSGLAKLTTLVGHMRLAALETKAQRFYKEYADEVEVIATDLDRVREGGDASSGSPGPDVDASRVSARRVEAAVRESERAGSPEEGAVAVGPQRRLGESQPKEVGDISEAFVFVGEQGIGVDRSETNGHDIVYDPVLGRFLFDKKSVVTKSRAVNALRDFGRQREPEIWREETLEVDGKDVKVNDVAQGLVDDNESLRKLEGCLG